MSGNFSDRRSKLVLFLCNAAIMIAAVTASLIYAKTQRANQLMTRQADFIATVESMKSVSQNYLDSERGYVYNWSKYICDENMTLKEALAFLRKINTNSMRFCHIVDMDTRDAWSAYYPEGEEQIDTYKAFKGDTEEYEQRMVTSLWEIFNGTEADFSVMGKYMLKESMSTAVSVGTRVTLQTEAGPKDYLLLRAIPTDALKRSWVFPAEYQSAEVGIITRDGDYVVQSPSMKSLNFPEYIRGYNFQEDYNRVNSFREELMASSRGILHYRNFRGEDCFWYYSSFGDGSDLDILGMIREEELQPSGEAWLIVLIICGSLAVLILIDGIYLARVNRKLRETARQAEEASQAKTQFLSAMSHDIRTPMNAILGMMSIAQQNVQDPEYVTQCLNKSMRAGRQLLTLINDILDISKIESGKYVLTPAQVSLPELMTELQEVLVPQTREKGQQFTCTIGALPYPVVMADSMRLNQIYMNLLSNAMKYTPPGGSIQVELTEEPAELDKSLTHLVFRVSDNGIGMSPEYQKSMYRSFSRAVSTQVNQTQGSGLGLAIVRQMVDLMHGTITCQSEVGKGTTFVVCLDLPIARQAAGSNVPQEGDDQDVSGLHILVAEDNEMNWEIIQVLLQEMGITCDRAENGKVCLERIASVPPGTYDAIFMDIQMPEMNGMEAAKHIRQLPKEQNRTIPIVAMTADAFAEDVQACLDCGMNGHIAKPIDIHKLRLYLLAIKNRTL